MLLALFMDGVLFGSAALMSIPHPGYWCIYLTHWTLVAVCAHLTLSAAGTVAARRSLARGDPISPRPCWLPVVWSAQAIALPGSLLVFVLFWCEPACMAAPFDGALTPRGRRALVYPGYRPASSVPINYFVHGANFGAMVVDAVLSNAPYFFVYIWSSWLMFAIIYVLFTIVYFFAGGTDENGNVRDPSAALHPQASVLTCPPPNAQPYSYAVIQWGSRAGAASAGVLTGIIVFVVVPLLGLLAYWLVFLRRTRLARKGSADEEETPAADDAP